MQLATCSFAWVALEFAAGYEKVNLINLQNDKNECCTLVESMRTWSS